MLGHRGRDVGLEGGHADLVVVDAGAAQLLVAALTAHQRHHPCGTAVGGLVEGYMPMGANGMAEMGAMEMEMPDNTLPMMTGYGPFGPLEMGGMFSVLKVREGLATGDYADPGWFENPPGTQAYEWTGDLPDANGNSSSQDGMPGAPASGHKH